MANAPFNFEELARALMTVRPALPTFSGLDHECPDKYLQKCTAYITATHLPESQQVATLQEGLQGEAKKWWQSYQVMELDFASYQQLIKSRWSATNGTSSRLPAAEVSALCETSTRRDRGGQSRGDDRPAAPWITENGENLQRPKLRHAV
uniref:Retrotransposon gag domain-containing protein n=1 Tax=Trichogramma kaykai TaxID=54128 RepID=A0ABD2VY36_9HYME